MSEIGCLITDDETVHQLNRDYRGIDETTDVLAFALTEEVDDAPAFPNAPDGLQPLGEVIISYPMASRQARERGHSAQAEVAVLAIHGILHLLGYDHDTDEQERVMRELEERHLKAFLQAAEKAG